MRAIRLSAWFVSCVLCAAARAQTWTELGPAPTTGFSGATGRVSSLVAHPDNPSLYYAAGADGGVWRTTDAGVTWTPLTDDLPTTAIGALALDPSNADVLYAGSGEGNYANHSRFGLGLYKTTDGGETWRVLAPQTFAGRCFSTLIIHPRDPQLLFAAITRAGGFPTLAGAKGHPDAAGPTGLFRSTDAGETWTLMGNGLPCQDASDVVIDPSNPDVMYAAIGHIFGSPDNGVYRSADRGQTWSRITIPIASPGRLGLAAAAGRVWVMMTQPADPFGGSGYTVGVSRSLDAGATWSTPASAGSAPYGWYFARVAVHPTNPDLVYAGELNLYRSSNGGLSFNNIGPPHPDVHGMTWDASGRLLVGCDGGVYRSANGQNSWISLNQRLGITQMYAGLSLHPTNPEIVFAGLQDNGTVLRQADTLLWNTVTGGDGGWTQISPHNPRHLFSESQGTGYLSRSTDGGLNFSGIGGGLSGRNCFLPPYLVDPAVPNRILYATERIFVSTNNGSSFTPLSPDLTLGAPAAIRALAIAPSDSRYVYAATNDRRVLASTDGGATFTLRLSNNPGWPRVTRELRVHPYEPATVYLAGAVFGQPHVRRSVDAGATWEILDGPGLPDTPVNVIGVDPRGLRPVLYAGADGGVFRSADDGRTWYRLGDMTVRLPNAAVIDMHVEPHRNRLVISTQGRGSWEIALPCPNDYNGDGFVDFFDYSDFVEGFERGDRGADTSGDGFIDLFDYTMYVEAFENGC